MIPLNLLFLFILFNFKNCLKASENDVHKDFKNLYPPVCVAIGINRHAHTLPYVMGLIENLKYPKNKLNILFVAQEESDGDTIEAAKL